MFLGEQLPKRVHQCADNVIVAPEVSGLNRCNAHSIRECHFSSQNPGADLLPIDALEHVYEQVIIEPVFHIDSAWITQDEVYSHFCNVLHHVIAGVVKIGSGLKHENITE